MNMDTACSFLNIILYNEFGHIIPNWGKNMQVIIYFWHRIGLKALPVLLLIYY